jgi:beta-lactamase class A
MKRILFIVLGFSLIANILLGVFIFNQAHAPDITDNKTAQDYPLLSPRLFTDTKNDIIINFVSLRRTLSAYVREHQLYDSTKTDNIRFGMYFEYLPSGISIGINEKTSYVAASLLKVPIIMSVYKFIESGKIKEDDLLTIKEEDLDPNFGDVWKKGVGAKISANEAIQLALIKSDNTAKAVLFSHIPANTLDEVFNYLDIPNDVNGDTPVVTPKNYSSILRSLYLSSYLTPDYSSKVLTYLTQSDFNDKISAGVPANIKVAHKIGVHDTQDQTKSIYTDCGIVYVPKRPYMVCLMMRDTEENAQLHMKAVSKLIYDFVSSANKAQN